MAPVVGRVAVVSTVSQTCSDQSIGVPSLILRLASAAERIAAARVAVLATPAMPEGYAARTAERLSESSWCTLTMVMSRQSTLSGPAASAASSVVPQVGGHASSQPISTSPPLWGLAR